MFIAVLITGRAATVLCTECLVQKRVGTVKSAGSVSTKCKIKKEWLQFVLLTISVEHKRLDTVLSTVLKTNLSTKEGVQYKQCWVRQCDNWLMASMHH